MSLDKAGLLALFQPKIIDADIPGVGAVRLRELSAPEVSDLREACKGAESDFGFRLVIASLVDDSGQLLLTADDLPAVRAGSQRTLGEVVAKVMEINGFSLKADAVKN